MTSKRYPENLEELLVAFQALDENLSPLLGQLLTTVNELAGEMAVHNSLLRLLVDAAPGEVRSDAAEVVDLHRLVEGREN